MWHSNVARSLLLALVIAASLGVVSSQNQSRKLFVSLQQEKERARQMEVEWGQLQLEQSTLAAPARVERIAVRQLQMQQPKKEQIRFIRMGKISSGNGVVEQQP
jgi:cell division protein FtsL